MNRLAGIVAAALPLALVSGCSGEAPEVESTAQELISDPQALPDIFDDFGHAASIPVPPGYGTYCSITDTSGNWALQNFGQGGDPCTWMRNQGYAGTVQRAGLWSVNHNNNVLVQCTSGFFKAYNGLGTAPITQAYNDVNQPGFRGCTFTISPVALPVFGSPINASSVPNPSNHNYDLNDNNEWWNPTAFGGTADAVQQSSACAGVTPGTGNVPCTTNSDCGLNARTGNQTLCMHQVPTDQPTCLDPVCAGTAFDRTGQEWEDGQGNFVNGGPQQSEPAYDWNLPAGTQLLAVADGVVRGSACRNIDRTTAAVGPLPNGSDCLEELFIEHEVGTGTYAEHFISGYHHMDWNGHVFKDSNGSWLPMPPAGWKVHRGDVIGIVGNSGTGALVGAGIHLDLFVVRTTNITGARAYPFFAEGNVSLFACNTDSDCATLNNGLTGYQCVSTTTKAFPCSTLGDLCACLSVDGINGKIAVIDPFGWAAPKGIDPTAWMFIGRHDPLGPASVSWVGAFSLNLWDPPPSGPPPYGATVPPPIPPTVGPTGIQ